MPQESQNDPSQPLSPFTHMYVLHLSALGTFLEQEVFAVYMKEIWNTPSNDREIVLNMLFVQYTDTDKSCHRQP